MKNSLFLLLFFFCALLLACQDVGETASSPVRGRDRTPTTAPATFSYEERQGKHIYLKYCAVCHGVDGKGDGFNSYNLDPKPRDFTDSTFMKTLSDARFIETISQGGRGVNKSPFMPSWGATLSKNDIVGVTYYLKTFYHSTKIAN